MKTICGLLVVVFAVSAWSSSGNNQNIVSNGNCEYNNGWIRENGVSRRATTAEVREMDDYSRAKDEYARRLADWTNTRVDNALSSGGRTRSAFEPRPPTAPCLCSAESCRNGNVNIVQSRNNAQDQRNYPSQAYSGRGEEEKRNVGNRRPTNSDRSDSNQYANNRNSNQQNNYGQNTRIYPQPTSASQYGQAPNYRRQDDNGRFPGQITNGQNGNYQMSYGQNNVNYDASRVNNNGRNANSQMSQGRNNLNMIS